MTSQKYTLSIPYFSYRVLIPMLILSQKGFFDKIVLQYQLESMNPDIESNKWKITMGVKVNEMTSSQI